MDIGNFLVFTWSKLQIRTSISIYNLRMIDFATGDNICPTFLPEQFTKYGMNTMPLTKTGDIPKAFLTVHRIKLQKILSFINTSGKMISILNMGQNL